MTDIRILHEDADIIVAVKPHGIESQASADGNDMIARLSAHTGGEIYPVHRLDRGTEGITVYAKTKPAAAFLSDAFASGATEKTYLAVLCGIPDERDGTYEDLLYHDRTKNKSYVVSRKRTGVKRAALSYSVLDIQNFNQSPHALVRVKLYTGRTHQIRVQFASRKTPLLGDVRYGGKPHPSVEKGAFALAAVYLSFPHPATKEKMTFSVIPSGEVWRNFSLTDFQAQ